MKLKIIIMSMLVCLSLLTLQGCTAEDADPQVNTALVQPSEAGASSTFIEPETLSTAITITGQALAPYFAGFDNATMLISDGSSIVAYNEPLSKTQQSPCSTFKIPNSLIALEEGVISIESSGMQWDGTIYSREEINQDQDLASAMKTSCVWYYQELARRAGADTMQNYLDTMAYGNRDISGGIDAFWLTSSLLISPQEQLEFIVDFYNYDLPFSREHIDFVKSILHQDQYSIDLYGKTGSSGDGMGWFVGYALIENQPYYFSAYAEGMDVSGLAVRDVVAQIFSDFNTEL